MRLYFHFTNGREVLTDVQGIEVVDLEEARRDALSTITEMRSDNQATGQDWSGWTLRVVDASGTVVFTIDLDSLAC